MDCQLLMSVDSLVRIRSSETRHQFRTRLPVRPSRNRIRSSRAQVGPETDPSLSWPPKPETTNPNGSSRFASTCPMLSGAMPGANREKDDTNLLQTISSLLSTLLPWIKEESDAEKEEAPEPSGNWPLVGHLHLFARGDPPHRAFGKLADTYGPAFTFHMGRNRTLVVNNWELAKECLTTNDSLLADRPPSIAGELMGYNNASFPFAAHGPYWRETRRIAMVELLSPRRLELLRHLRVTEVDMCVRDTYRTWAAAGGQGPVRVEMNRWLEELMYNTNMQMIAGKRYFGANVLESDEGVARRFRKLMRQFVELMGFSAVYDSIPLLKVVDLKGNIKEMKRVFKETDEIIQSWVEEHRNKGEQRNEGREDFIDVLLRVVGESKGPRPYDDDTVIKATTLAIIEAGVDTTADTMVWALALIMNNPHVLEKLQAEVDSHVGRDRVVDESDIPKLKYLHAVIKETLRLYPTGPIMVPHQAIEECQVGGFHVRRGSQVIVNVWKIQRDPRVWQDPEDFRPERFLTTHVDYDLKGQNFEIMPFGSGRRSCPGMSFALLAMHLILARLFHSFELSMVPGTSMDFDEALGLNLHKVTPISAMLTPRLPAKLYE